MPCGGAAWMCTARRNVRPVRFGRPRKAHTKWHTVRGKPHLMPPGICPGSHSSGPAYAGHSPLQRATARPACGPKPFIARRPGPPAGRGPSSGEGPTGGPVRRSPTGRRRMISPPIAPVVYSVEYPIYTT